MVKKRVAGFTLIELLVAIAIIGILATLIIIQIAHAETRSRNATAEANVNQAGKAVSIYITQYESVLDAVDSSGGAGTAYAPPASAPVFGVEKAFAFAGPPPAHGDQYASTNCAITVNPFTQLWSTTPQQYDYYVGTPIPQSAAYTYSYRTAATKVLTGSGCTSQHQEDGISVNFTLLTTLDTSDGTSPAYYWVNNGSPGSGAQAAIPAP